MTGLQPMTKQQGRSCFCKNRQHPFCTPVPPSRQAFLLEAARGAVLGSVLPTEQPCPRLEPEPRCPNPPRTCPASSSCIQTTASAAGPTCPSLSTSARNRRPSYLLDKILGPPRCAEVLPLPFLHPLLLLQVPLLLRGGIDVAQPQVPGHLPPQVPGDAWRTGRVRQGQQTQGRASLARAGGGGAGKRTSRQATCGGGSRQVPPRPLEPALDPGLPAPSLL